MVYLSARISWNGSAARKPATLPQRIAIARNASAERGCGYGLTSLS